MYCDYLIIGGGIAGLYAMQELHKKDKQASIVLCDDRSYLGGRLKTHETLHYEIGGARFHDQHSLLLSLISQYKCHKIPLPKETLFLEQISNKPIIPYHNVGETLTSIMTQIIKESKNHSKTFLQQFSLAHYITHKYKDKVLTKKIKDIFGYDTEINVMNAYDALHSFEMDFLSNQFYILQEGLSTLCTRMYEAHNAKSNLTFHLNTHIDDVKKDDLTYIVSSASQQWNTKHVVFATKAPQLRDFPILKPIYPYLSCIYGAPLLRIYAKYPLQQGKVWFHDFPKIITNNILRQIIPIDPKSGLIMISYTDNDDITPFYENKRQKKLRDKRQIQAIIARELKILFPSYIIPKPTYFATHLWTLGCHHWKPTCDSQQIIQKTRNPLNNVFIVGEAFSRKQAWMEGALESVKDMMNHV